MSKAGVRRAARGDEDAERTFLIADVRGYTRFTRERGDAEAARLAGTFAGHARDAVAARSGRVIELRGDEALAVFVTPAQAVRAAVELQAACEEALAADPSLPLRVGVGIDVGVAVPMEDGFRGAALNTAARLCAKAAAGQVFVTARLADCAGPIEGVTFRNAGTAELKGFEAPVELVEVVAEARRAPPLEGGVRLLPPALEPDTPLLGREMELAWLRGTWRQARRGHGRLVFVSGPARIGKTRLAAEAAAFAAADNGGATVSYSGAGGTAAASGIAALRAAVAEPGATLLVLDDVDVTGNALAPTLADLFDRIEAASTLIVALVRDPDVTADVAQLVGRADERGDGHRRLGPLDAVGVREIARLYVGNDVAEVPLESIGRASGAVPGHVHELMSEWAEREATRRLSAAAEWLAAGRSGRSADVEFANNVIRLKLARLFGDDPRGDADGGACPYKGLASFSEGDARRFFGRERLVGELAARTVGAGLLAVVGASGSGKSSLIAAGLIPSLKAGLLPGSDRWRCTLIRPGEHPLAALATVQASGSDERLVLVIDQFEETFTACDDQKERDRFLEELVGIAADSEHAVVVLGLRADFAGECATHPELARLITENMVLVGPMSAEELRRAIELPARRGGLRVESALAEALVAEIGDEPGGLPLLSTALVELWLARSDGWLRLADHERLGGVRGAVARLAETAYDNLTEDQRSAARRLFLRLVMTGEEGALVRRRVPLSELDVTRDAALSSLIERLTTDRLLTAYEGAIEVAHEALLREWPRLQDWLADDAQGRELREHLTQSAKRWQERDHDHGDLYRGARLTATLEWAATRQEELNKLERDFLAESRAASERELERQRRTNRRLKGLLAGVGVLLLAALAAGTFALIQRAEAQRKAKVALARQLGAEAVSEPRIDRAMLLAGEAMRIDSSVQTRGTLLATLLRSPAAIATFTLPITTRPLQTAVSPDGKMLAVADNASQVRFFDTQTHRETRAPLKQHGFGVAPSYSADGRRVFVVAGGPSYGFEDRDTRAYHIAGPQLALRADKQWLTKPTGSANLFRLTRDGRRAYFGYDLVSGPPSKPKDGPGMLDRWNVATGKLLGTVPLRTSGLQDVALVDHDRELIAVGDSNVTFWALPSLRELRSLSFHLANLQGATIAPSGRTAALDTTAGLAFVLNLRSGAIRQLSGGHLGAALALAFFDGGRRVAVAGEDGTVIVWDVKTRDELETLSGHGGRIVDIRVAADGQTLYSCSLDGAVFKWDLGTQRRFGRPFRFATPLPQGATTPPLAVSPDSSQFAVAIGSNRVALYDSSTLRRRTTFRAAGDEINRLAWLSPSTLAVASPTRIGLWQVGDRPQLVRLLHGLRPTIAALAVGGRTVAAVDSVDHGATRPPTGELAVWNARSGTLLHRRNLGSDGSSIAFSPHGTTIAVGLGGDAQVDLFNAVSLRRERTVTTAGQAPVLAVAYSSDGTLATGNWSGILQLWRTKTGAPVGHAVLATPSPVATVSFSPRGEMLATTGGTDGDAKLWSTPTQQQLALFTLDPGNWGAAQIAPNGNYVVVAYQDGTGYVWPTSTSAWLQHACAVAGRNFTGEEWRRYVGHDAYSRVCPAYPSG